MGQLHKNGKTHIHTHKYQIYKKTGKNYIATNLIDGLYVKYNNTLSIETIYKSHTLINQKLNSNHYPVILKIPSNTLISRPPTNTKPSSSKLPNTIPSHQLQALQSKFLTENAHTLSQLTRTLQNEAPLNDVKWTQIVTRLDNLISKLSNTFEEICVKPPPPQLTGKKNHKEDSYLEIYKNNGKNNLKSTISHPKPYIQHNTTTTKETTLQSQIYLKTFQNHHYHQYQ